MGLVQKLKDFKDAQINKITDLLKKKNPNATKADAVNIKKCAETGADDVIQPQDQYSNNDSVEDRKSKMSNQVSGCGNKMKSEDANGVEQGEFEQDPCAKIKTKLLVDEVAEIAGDGIDDSVPAQEGFIPPQCYEYAKTILEAVRNDALFGNADNSYNSSAILLDPVIEDMRDHQEVAKYFITSKDNSNGSKALMENTMQNPKYAQIFGNKDVMDFKDSLFNTKG